MKMLKKNDIIELNIDDLTNLGFGVGRHEGKVVFVSDLIPGDRALVKIIKVNKNFLIGRCEKLIVGSQMRCESRCPVNTCKSCPYRLISYNDELKYKRETIVSAFTKEGLRDTVIGDVTPSPLTYHYRNKAQYPISKNSNGDYVIGFYAPKSHRVTEARNCPLSPEVFTEILDTLSTFFKKHELSVYDEETREGLLRHVYLRRGEVSGEILVTLVINGEKIPHEEELCNTLREKFSQVVGILINTNKEDTNVVLGDRYRTIFGRDYIYDTLSGVRLKIMADAFYQVNHSATELLYKKAKELADPQDSDTILDLFCGAGSIGLSMVRGNSAQELIGIEIVENAVICARENATDNGISNAKFYTGDASSAEKLLSIAEREIGEKINPNIIILDPPRAGCSEELIRYITTLDARKIVYISCNPTTLARDISLFRSLGYQEGEVFGFDLFAMTGHVESVVCLTRRSDVDMRR